METKAKKCPTPYFFGKNNNFLFLGFLCLLILVPYKNNQHEIHQDSLTLSIIQPSLDPFKKYEPGSYQSIEETLVNLTNKNMMKSRIVMLWG